ncbi:unnamed protein product [Trichobilharzia regenti]|nr:unnamed protein product [Trichobilharzia regenti]
MFENYDKPLTVRARRDAFKKLVDPIIGVPLSQRFRSEVQIHNLPRLNRPKWNKSLIYFVLQKRFSFFQCTIQWSVESLAVENSNYDKMSNTFEVSNIYGVIRDQASLKHSMGG